MIITGLSACERLLLSEATLGILALRFVFGSWLQRPPSEAGLPRDTFGRPAASGPEAGKGNRRNTTIHNNNNTQACSSGASRRSA